MVPVHYFWENVVWFPLHLTKPFISNLNLNTLPIVNGAVFDVRVIDDGRDVQFSLAQLVLIQKQSSSIAAESQLERNK